MAKTNAKKGKHTAADHETNRDRRLERKLKILSKKHPERHYSLKKVEAKAKGKVIMNIVITNKEELRAAKVISNAVS